MSAHVEEHIDLCTGFALGTLEETQHRQVVERLRTCEACDDRIDVCNDVLVTVARAAAPVDPPAALRAKVMADIFAFTSGDVAAAQPQARHVEVHTSNVLSWKGWLAVWGALVLAIALIASRNEISQLRRELAEARGIMARATQSMTEGVFWGQIVNATGARVVWLAGGPDVPRGWVTLEPGNGHVAGLFTQVRPPADHDYVLWAMHGTRPTRLGVLNAGSKGRAALRHARVADAATITGFQVSLERTDQAAGTAPAGRIVTGAKLAD